MPPFYKNKEQLFMKYTKLISLALALCLLCGCSVMPFTTPEEQLAAQQAAESARLELQEQVDPAQALKDNLKFRKALANSQGTILAEYTVDFPYFSKTDQKRYVAAVKKADEQVILSDYYYRGCMQVRDKYMAERGDVMLAYCRKTEGGAAYTVRCFQKLHPDAEIIFL
jgi:hypothetical protein